MWFKIKRPWYWNRIFLILYLCCLLCFYKFLYWRFLHHQKALLINFSWNNGNIGKFHRFWRLLLNNQSETIFFLQPNKTPFIANYNTQAEAIIGTSTYFFLGIFFKFAQVQSFTPCANGTYHRDRSKACTLYCLGQFFPSFEHAKKPADYGPNNTKKFIIKVWFSHF
jgi:hypothetical protein